MRQMRRARETISADAECRGRTRRSICHVMVDLGHVIQPRGVQSEDPGETESGERCGTGGADVMYTAYVHGVLSGVLLWYRDMVLIFPNGDFPPNDPTIWHSS